MSQGNTIKRFMADFENIFWKMNWESMEENINGEYLNHLWFADDILLISEMLNCLNRQSLNVNLKMDRKQK